MDAPQLVSREEWTAARVALLAASNTALAKIEAYRQRMGWRFTWVSALGTDFNRDFHVSFAAEELSRGDAWYDYRSASPHFPEMQGLSVFVKLADGRVAHAYSTYGRGIGVFNGAYPAPRSHPPGAGRGRRTGPDVLAPAP